MQEQQMYLVQILFLQEVPRKYELGIVESGIDGREQESILEEVD